MDVRGIAAQTIPDYKRPTEEDLKKRAAAFAEIRAIRERMQPLGCSVVELIREDREASEQ